MTKIANTDDLLKVVRKHMGSNDSAVLCHDDAVALFARGSKKYACNRCVDSLRHSVGIFNIDYKEAVLYVAKTFC